MSSDVVSKQPISENVREWSTGLYGCMEDVKGCIMGYFCGPCTVGRLSTRLGDHYCMPCCAQGGFVAMRTKVRILGGIQGTICTDYLVTQFCGPCAICQLEREMDAMNI